MANKVKAIPDGYHSVTPYLFVKNGVAALEFYKKAFGAEEIMRAAEPNGKVSHAEIKMGDSLIMLADEHPECDALSPQTVGGSPVTLHFYVEDVDAVVKNALNHGAKQQRPVTDQFYGDRSGSVIDPFGHVWNIATHIEDVSPEEIFARYEKMKQKG